jgi:seryl-tRNA synthetase
MLQIQFLRENPQEVISRLAVKHFDAGSLVEKIIGLDDKRRVTQKKRDDILAEANNLSREIGNLFKSGQADQANVLKERTVELKALTKELETELEGVEKEQKDLLILLPNLPHFSVPSGHSAADNQVVFEWGEVPDLGPDAKPHWDLASEYDIIDFELGNKVTGAGFPFYKKQGAKLQRALINFFLDEAVNAGYTELQPPLFVNEDSAYGTGQLPDKDGQMYYMGMDNLYAIPTAEVPVTNVYRDLILKEEELPRRNAAYSSCFRREAGSYGKDVRGLNRLHQFDKVEIVQVSHPSRSYEILEEMREHVASLLKKLGLTFRVVKLCGGDMSFTSALTYDFEVYSGAQKRWLEVSSVSNFESFQSNRMKIRFKDKDGKSQLVHTLNGSALALPRVVAALLENNQHNGFIIVPSDLTKYTGFDKITK